MMHIIAKLYRRKVIISLSIMFMILSFYNLSKFVVLLFVVEQEQIYESNTMKKSYYSILYETDNSDEESEQNVSNPSPPIEFKDDYYFLASYLYAEHIVNDYWNKPILAINVKDIEKVIENSEMVEVVKNNLKEETTYLVQPEAQKSFANLKSLYLKNENYKEDENVTIGIEYKKEDLKVNPHLIQYTTGASSDQFVPILFYRDSFFEKYLTLDFFNYVIPKNEIKTFDIQLNNLEKRWVLKSISYNTIFQNDNYYLKNKNIIIKLLFFSSITISFLFVFSFITKKMDKKNDIIFYHVGVTYIKNEYYRLFELFLVILTAFSFSAIFCLFFPIKSNEFVIEKITISFSQQLSVLLTVCLFVLSIYFFKIFINHWKRRD